MQRFRKGGARASPPRADENPAGAARALHDAEERYRLAARATNDVIWDYDLIAHTVQWNEALTRRFGHAPAGLVTPIAWWEEIIHADDAPRVTASIDRVINGAGEYWAEEYRLRRADGDYADVLDRGYVIRDDHGLGVRMVGAILDLSDRKTAEAALRASEERLRLAQEAVGLGTYEWIPGGEAGEVSDTFRTILGYAPGTPITMDALRAVIHPADRARVDAHIVAASRGRCPDDIEFRIIRPSDGSERWVWFSARTFFEGNTPTRRLGVVEDITKRKEAEARVRESEEMLRLAQEAAGIGSFEWNAETGEGRASDNAFQIFGLPITARMVMQELLYTIHPDDRDAVTAYLARAAAGLAEGTIEFRINRPSDGETRWIRISGRRVDRDGLPARRVGVVEDITDRKLAEARLRESEENYRYTVELSPQLAWTADGDGSNIEFKRHAAEFPDVPGPGQCSDWTDRLTHPDDVAYRRREWEFAMRSGRPYDVEFRVRRGDGEYRWVRSRGYPRRNKSGEIVKWYGVTEEIHAQRVAEQQLQKLQAELTQVARVSAMGTLASTLAHELNQPLTAVANYLAGSKRLLINHGATATPVIAEALENASKAAVQAGEIVRRLRDLVARGEVNAQRVELAGLIHEACELTFGDGRDRSIELSLEFGPDTRAVFADRIQVQQVLVNLLRNAAEAMADSPTRVITLSVMRSGTEQVTVRVEDSGPGVSPDVKRHLFSPFVTTKESGMGVGLSICRSIVEAHRGQLWVEDTASGGAAFCFTLHRAPAD